jgi:hypothetical protein
MPGLSTSIDEAQGQQSLFSKLPGNSSFSISGSIGVIYNSFMQCTFALWNLFRNRQLSATVYITYSKSVSYDTGTLYYFINNDEI